MGYRKITNLQLDNPLFLFKEVWACEKIHGCVDKNTRVRLADGSKKEIYKLINENAIGTEVLGVKDGKIVTTKITNVFDNGFSEDWLTIEATRVKSGRGGNETRINCTPNHRFWVESDYKEASTLKIGDTLSLLRTDLELTPLQKQILIGKMLGDGTLVRATETASLEFGHEASKEAYIDWCLRGLGNICESPKRHTTSGYGSDMIRTRTNSLFFIKETLDCFIINGEKHIPSSLVENIGPIALAFWYMDDGSLNHHKDQEDRVAFATCAFSEQDCEILLKCLSKFGIKGDFYTTHNVGNPKAHSRLKLNAVEAEKFFLLVAPYIPPVMQYKLPERYRGHPGWLPDDSKGTFKEHLVEQTITKITKLDKSVSLFKAGKLKKYDIETETHNFFANDLLVHNSSCNISMQHDLEKGWTWSTFAGGITHTTFESMLIAKYRITEEVIPKLTELMKGKDTTSITFYGEGYGGKCQGMVDVYGPLNFIVFEVQKDDRWCGVEESAKFCELVGLPFVPFEKGPATVEWLDSQRDKPSDIAKRNGTGDDKEREGIVVRAPMELFDDNGGRLIAKYKRENFRETKTARPLTQEELEVIEDAKEIAEEWVVEERLNHVLSSLVVQGKTNFSMKDTADVINEMIKDVATESLGKIIWSEAAAKAIGNKTRELFKKRIMSGGITNPIENR